jgi:hypothetical protein
MDRIPDPDDDPDGIDACSFEVSEAEATADEDLPAAEGGIA